MKKRFTIMQRLIFSFSSILVLTALIAVFGILSVVNLGGLINKLFNQSYNVSGSALWAQYQLSEAGSTLKDILIYKEFDKNVQEITVCAANVNACLDEIDQSFTHPEMTQDVRDKLSDFLATCTTGIEIIKSGDTEKGMAMVPGIKEKFAAIEESLSLIIQQTSAESEELAASSGRAARIAYIILIALCLICCGIGAFIEIKTERSIVRPVNYLNEVAGRIAGGDLDIDVTFNRNDELGDLAKSFSGMAIYLKTVISDIDNLLDEMSSGNFNVSASAEYIGCYSDILGSLNRINSRLSDTLSQINTGAEQVAAGTEHVSEGAQALATGATEQAAAVEELSASIIEISKQIRETARNAREADEITKRSTEDISSGRQQMEQMIVSISEISNMSSEIGKIIKTIDDIAFQTNILALNAAVEAARAGEAGKGFAVVADEVRNLAQKSAGAAKNTTALIEGTVAAVDKGTLIADDTAKSLNTIIDTSQRVSELVMRIADASERQAEAVDQVTIGVSQISQVVQTNSATSEESASASEELFSQAQMLRDLVATFKLRALD